MRSGRLSEEIAFWLTERPVVAKVVVSRRLTQETTVWVIVDEKLSWGLVCNRHDALPEFNAVGIQREATHLLVAMTAEFRDWVYRILYLITSYTSFLWDGQRSERPQKYSLASASVSSSLSLDISSSCSWYIHLVSSILSLRRFPFPSSCRPLIFNEHH